MEFTLEEVHAAIDEWAMQRRWGMLKLKFADGVVTLIIDESTRRPKTATS